jgi:cytochrome c-type biogenesis protein CcmH/NrfF
MNGVVTSVRTRVQDSGLRNPSSEDGSKSIPADLSALVATNQYAPPQPSNTPAQGIDPEHLGHALICMVCAGQDVADSFDIVAISNKL